MKISVVLAVYNGSNYLGEQLASYLNQSRVPDELIAVDDCSTDDTVEILKDFAQSSGIEVRILRNEKNLGSTLSFSKAIEHATGELILPSDHDNIWSPDRVDRMSSYFQKDPDLVLLFSNARLADQNGTPLDDYMFDEEKVKIILKAVNSDSLVAQILKENVVGGAVCAFRSRFKQYIVPIPLTKTFIHDAWIGLVLGSIGKSVFLPESTLLFRQHSGQQIGARGKSAGRQSQTKAREAFFLEGLRRLRDRESDIRTFSERLSLIEKDLVPTPRYLAAAAATEQALKDALEHRAHFERRAKLDRSVVRRISQIYKELISGNYWKYSNGLRSVVRDLIYR
jgi:glycosyltransferase involved in cell wall biosynthesis